MEFVGFVIDPVDMDISMNCEKPNSIIFKIKIVFNQPNEKLFRFNIGSVISIFPQHQLEKEKICY